MQQFFARDWHGAPFVMFGPAHIAALLVLLAFNIWLLRFRGAPESSRRKVRLGMALTLWTAETAWHAWNYFTGQWSVQYLLPLQVCSILIWLSGFMLIFKNQTIYEFAYFMGIGGAMQYLFTPDLGIYGFPHFRFFQTYISHGLLVTSAIYMTTVEGLRPTWKSMLRVIVVSNIYMVAMYFLNSAIGSNYLFVNHKPYTPSIIDLLPAWPVYILYLEFIGLVTFLLLYLPFAIRDWRTRAIGASNGTNPS